jgi:predicted short-subunit dehydrogenase-like oxidoreductase (DUF2520 family)
MNIQSVVILGTGNLAHHLVKLLPSISVEIKQIYGRNESAVEVLAKTVNASFTSNINDLDQDADAYLIAVSDAAISELAEKIKVKNKKIVMHTAGSISMEAIQFTSNYYGIFYPLQTFTRDSIIDFRSTPIFIEANNDETKVAIENLAKRCSEKVQYLKSNERLKLHLSAVLTSNFINHLNALTFDYLKENDLQYLYPSLIPLMQTSLEKLKTLSPKDAQTGPARRNDLETINKHLHLLLDDPNLSQIYQLLSTSITNYYQS